MQSFCLLLFEGSGLLSNLGGWIASAPVNIEPDHQANRKSPLYVSCMLFTVSCLTSTCSSGPLLSLLLVLCFLIILVWGVVLFTFCRKTYLTFTFAVWGFWMRAKSVGLELVSVIQCRWTRRQVIKLLWDLPCMNLVWLKRLLAWLQLVQAVPSSSLLFSVFS